MEYKICKLEFSTGVHFGNGRLTDSEYTLHADTLFSALCIEAIRSGGKDRLNKLVHCARNDKIKISNGFPYIKETLFLPKPGFSPKIDETKREREDAKAYKKLQYISVQNFSKYLNGDLKPANEREALNRLGKTEFQAKVAIINREEPEPYHIGFYRFYPNAGIYFFIGYENKQLLDELIELIDMVGMEGVGGKRSAGLGKFRAKMESIPNEMELRLKNAEIMKTKVSLSLSLPKEEEMEKSMEGAAYLLEKRSGFVASDTYAATWRKKKDLFCFQAGSCFKNVFLGDIYDVSIDGSHPVYRYAKPFFMGVNV